MNWRISTGERATKRTNKNVCLSSASIWASIFSGDSLDSSRRCSPSLNSQNLTLFSLFLPQSLNLFFIYEKGDSKKRSRKKTWTTKCWPDMLWLPSFGKRSRQVALFGYACTNCSTATCVLHTRLFIDDRIQLARLPCFCLFPLPSIKIGQSVQTLFFSDDFYFQKKKQFCLIQYFCLSFIYLVQCGQYWNRICFETKECVDNLERRVERIWSLKPLNFDCRVHSEQH